MFHTNADITPYSNPLLLDDDIQQAQRERHLYGGIKIHGKYCGPTWTANKAKVAKDVPREVYESVLPIDPLDGACRIHDWDCGHTGIKGECSRADDTKLIKKAMKIARDKSQPLAFRAKAYVIANAIAVARTTRGSGMEGGRGLFTDVGYNYKFGDIMRWIFDMERPEKKVHYPPLQPYPSGYYNYNPSYGSGMDIEDTNIKDWIYRPLTTYHRIQN